jgi:hypothetical protein
LTEIQLAALAAAGLSLDGILKPRIPA